MSHDCITDVIADKSAVVDGITLVLAFLGFCCIMYDIAQTAMYDYYLVVLMCKLMLM